MCSKRAGSRASTIATWTPGRPKDLDFLRAFQARIDEDVEE
jgi:hypothetical protein